MHQIRLLTRTFFTRMFESDLMPEGLPQVQLVLWGVLLAATPTSGYPLLLADKYAVGQFYQPLATEFDTDRMILITLSMVAMGVVSLVIWDGVFPDRRDVRVLGVLPVPTRSLVLARLVALAQVFVLSAAAICLLQSILFPLLVAGFGDTVPRHRGVFSHLITVLSACTFVFCSLIAAQCLLLLLFGRRAAQAASVVFQVLFAVGLIQLLVFLGQIGRILRTGGRSHEGLSALAALPTTWFFGLYERLSGTADGAAASFATIAIAATIASAVLSVALYAASYSHLSARALEGPPPQSARGRRWLTVPVLSSPQKGFSSPLRTAIRLFAVRTMLRSRSHRMILAVYAGVALAIVFSSAASVAMRDRGAGLWQPGIAMLSMPLVFQFLLLIGIRVIMSIPSEPKARWLFRACEPGDRAEAVSAAHDMMLTTVVLPTAVFALAQGLIFWSAAAAASHALVCLTVGNFFAELLLARTGKLPFACTYFPGKSRVFTLWPLYLVIFFFYTVVIAAVERGVLLHRPGALLVFCTFVLIATRILVWIRRRALAALPGLLFEEEDPNAIFEGFNLSEGLAAAPRAAANR